MHKNSIIVFGIHKGKDELGWNRTDLKELGYSPSSVFGLTITPFFHLRISRKKLKMKFSHPLSREEAFCSGWTKKKTL
jgi:hypothetical protein